MLRLLLFLLLTLPAVKAGAAIPQKDQINQAAAKRLGHDTAKIAVRRFDDKKLAEYRADRDFNYKEDFQERSLWSRFWSWFWKMVMDLLPKGKASATAFKYLVIVIAIGVVIYAVLKLKGTDVFRRNKRTEPDVPFAESAENIHEINFDEEIERVIRSKNYKIAVRLLYLKCLKQLNDKRLIHWQPDKTNRAYIEEIAGDARRGMFSRLTLQFEYAWYGDFAVSGEGFEQIRKSFVDFNDQLK